MPKDSSLEDLKVLVVEDKLLIQQALDTLLKDFGCKAYYVSNGEQAIERLKSSTYDMVLMDINMPVMNGLEATKIIRRDISKKLPIIAMTADADKEQCLSAGMNDYIQKPFDQDEFKNKLLENI